MKFLHKPDLRIHTVHTEDIARAILLAGKWMMGLGRSEANKLAGESVRTFIKDGEWLHLRAQTKEVVVVPIFNLVSLFASLVVQTLVVLTRLVNAGRRERLHARQGRSRDCGSLWD
jgi:hypothetical protein